MELTGKINSVMRAENGKAILMLEVDKPFEARKCHEKYKEKELDIEVKQHREKRSLSANAYMWVLCEKIAQKLNGTETELTTKEDVYRHNIKEIGVFYDDEIEPEKVQRRRTAWELIGEGWLTERVDFSQDGNKEVIRFYYGSSRYSSKQMTRLLKNVVQEAQNLDIDTRTPNEIADMLSLWGQNEKSI